MSVIRHVAEKELFKAEDGRWMCPSCDKYELDITGKTFECAACGVSGDYEAFVLLCWPGLVVSEKLRRERLRQYRLDYIEKHHPKTNLQITGIYRLWSSMGFPAEVAAEQVDEILKDFL